MRQKFKCGGIYHVCNKSIANFAIFGSSFNRNRFINVLDYYNAIHVWTSFSTVLKLKHYQHTNLLQQKKDGLIKILSYCIMPDHYHILFKVISDSSISKYINDIENSYTRYFNLRHSRKGPLWQSSYRSVLIKTDEQLLHVSRYINLNPSSSNIVDRPDAWEHSSYRDMIGNQSLFQNLSEISIQSRRKYKKFVESNIEYQRNLKKIKSLLLE